MNFYDRIPIKMAENAAFFWILHDQALRGPNYTLAKLIELEARIDAQLDGLLVHGEAGWNACEAALRFEAPGEVFTATVLALRSDNSQWLQKAIETGCRNQRAYQALLSAFSWLPRETVKSWIGKLIQAQNPAYICLGISACALHGLKCGQSLNDAFNNPDIKKAPEYFAQIIRAAGLMQRNDLLPEIQSHVKDEQAQIAFSSIFASLLLGDKSNTPFLKPYVMNDMPVSDQAINVAFRALPQDEAKGWALELGKTSRNLRKLITATGIMGDAAALPWLLEQMSNASYARLAGHSFSLITGLDFELNAMTEAPVLSDKTDINDKDKKLPWPDAAKVRHWYESHYRSFLPEQRYLAGNIINEENLHNILQQGKHYHRVAAWQALQLSSGVRFTDEAPKRLRV